MIMQEDIGYYVKRIMKVFIRFSWGYSLSRMSLKTMLLQNESFTPFEKIIRLFILLYILGN